MGRINNSLACQVCRSIISKCKKSFITLSYIKNNLWEIMKLNLSMKLSKTGLETFFLISWNLWKFNTWNFQLSALPVNGKCTKDVKLTLFKSYCMCFLDVTLWKYGTTTLLHVLLWCHSMEVLYHNITTVNKLHLAHNKCIKIFFGFSRC